MPHALALNVTPIPVPSQIKSAGRLPKALLWTIVSKLGLLPPVSACALATTMPPELICVPRLPDTLLKATNEFVAPSSRMPPPCRFTGVSPCLGQNLLLADNTVVNDGDPARAALLPVIQDHDALAVPADEVVRDQDLPGVPDEDPELVAEGLVVAHHRVGVRRVPDVEPGLVVADRHVVGEQGPGGFEAGNTVVAVIDRHGPGHLQAVSSVAEHAVAREVADPYPGHPVAADGRDYCAVPLGLA